MSDSRLYNSESIPGRRNQPIWFEYLTDIQEDKLDKAVWEAGRLKIPSLAKPRQRIAELDPPADEICIQATNSNANR